MSKQILFLVFCLLQSLHSLVGQNGDWHEPFRSNPLSTNWYQLPYAIHDTQYVEVGLRIRDYGHNGYDMHALPLYENTNDKCDLDGDVGLPIAAARTGIVRYAVDKFCCRNIDSTDCPGINLDFEINSIFIQHSNDEWSVYHHIAQGSSRVNVGDLVLGGQVIANEGEVGPASSVHLHFAIYYGYIGPSDFTSIKPRQTQNYFRGQRIPLMCNTQAGVITSESIYTNFAVYNQTNDAGAIGPCGLFSCGYQDRVLGFSRYNEPYVLQAERSIVASNVKINAPIIEGVCDSISEFSSPFNMCSGLNFCADSNEGGYCRSNGGSVLFSAGERVRLVPGFHAKEGSYFRAEIGNCQ